MKLVAMMLSFLLIVSCGPSSNPVSHIIQDGAKESYEVQLSLAKSYYDQLNYKLANIHAEKAYKLNPPSEDAAITLGYSYLGLLELSPYSLIRKLLVTNTQEKNTVDDDSSEGASSVKDSDKKSSADELDAISNLIGLTTDDFNLLGTWDHSDSQLPLIIPYCASKARRNVKILTYIDRAIEVTCAFVNPELKLNSDFRHQCNSSSRPSKLPAKAHFLWVFGHLIEAVVFNKVITYSTTSSNKSNLELRMEKINTMTVTSAQELQIFMSSLEVFSQVVFSILPISSLCEKSDSQSQFSALLNDVITASKTLELMSGIPADIISGLVSSTQSLRDLGDNMKAQSMSLKKDIMQAISSTLTAKIDNISKTQPLTNTQKESICNSYSNISGEVNAGPAICKK